MDAGADLTVIGTRISKKLGIVLEKTEREWAASDGDELYSPITQVEIIEDGGRKRFSLDEVLVDDRPLDKESNEDVSWSGLFAKSKDGCCISMISLSCG